MLEWRWLIITLITSIFLIIGAALLLGKTNNLSVVTFSAGDSFRPQVSLDKKEHDFGRVEVNSTKEIDFILKNSGQKTLQIFDFSSSCNCTSVKIIKRDWQSREFGMHNRGQDSDIIEIPPQDQVIIKVIYRPFLMPVRGEVARQVYFSANDPLQSKITLTIKAQVFN